ncbi:hypothetical protein [Paenibacillus macerans]|uniref:hypothetical protein n=1 Tax=Paenibacillus macerans TaxID=44252 RepID=UPI00203C65B9|nr:hypothetical protein [Paenibacillus macerans]MCM3701324.1 hypothetical protein [Paenibacillus macerans]
MECIVHFEVMHSEGPKELRGLIFLDEGKLPTEADFLKMFEEMGYKLRLTDRENLVFEPLGSGADYSKIRVRRLDTGEKSYKEDGELKSLLSNLMPREFRPI